MGDMNGTALNVSSVKAIVAKYVKKAGTAKKVSIHTRRHTFRAHKADKHMSPGQRCRPLMGHKKRTMLKYIQLVRTIYGDKWWKRRYNLGSVKVALQGPFLSKIVKAFVI
jgi:integrase